MSKWNKKYFGDLAERVGSTAIGATIGALTAVNTTPVDWSDEKVIWAIIGVPTVISLLKGLALNMASGSAQAPTASLVDVSSNAE